MGFVTAERLIRGRGTAEPVWQRWLVSADIPSRSLDEWLPRERRLVVVAPHPDDEVLSCGGLLSLHAARGGDSLLVAVTDGEASHIASIERSAQALAVVRRAESAAGWSQLGLHDPAVLRLGLPDGQVDQHMGQLADFLNKLLLPSDVVVSTWRRDGHPDHDASGLCAAQACEAAGCRLIEAPVWMWHWALPGDLRVPWRRMLGLSLAPQTLIRKQAALAAHHSQLHTANASAAPILGEGILARSRRNTEYFFI